ncbi:MAG: LacI family DNA-binding transcriptional regulator [Opitutaceae bacterium]|nr:LacI family DNA-binding transcriptional regulator [Opitutaceae bacterium]
MPKPPTIRSLARRLRLSVATVSEALRDSPRVHATTRARVHRAAAVAGYQRNALLGAALSAVRQSRHHHFRGTIALIDIDEADQSLYLPFHREIALGAEARALELGFGTELFWVGHQAPAMTPRRLPEILHARGIAGAVLLPFHTAQDFSEFDFSRIAAVHMDHCLIRPRLHTIMPDHYVSMMQLLARLTQRGYCRIGLCIEARKDARVKGKWSAAFRTFDQSGIPALVAEMLTREDFLDWFNETQPDVVVGHVQRIVDWLRESSLAVPDDVGFVNLNMTERTAPCAGLDLGPRRLGATAVETVVGMLHRQERGVPASPQTIGLEAMWIDGPTLRAAPLQPVT